ncbi:MAG: hypothetical protein IKU90_03805 [Clostridia bacterium]|nr:hypothetical protein [Clostridia bacterium]
MKTYIWILLASSIAAAVIQLLAPKGENGGLGDHVRMIAGLFLVVSLLNPLKEGIALLRSVAEGDLSDCFDLTIPSDAEGDYEGVFHDALSFVGQEEVRGWVVSLLETEFGIPPSGCRVSVTCAVEGEIVAVEEVGITLLGRYAVEDPHPIESRVGEALSCPVCVTVELFN